LDATNPAEPSSDPDEPRSGDSTPPKNISPTDPGARWTAVRGGPAFYAYSTNYLIDLDAGIIVDVEATPAHRTEEVDATRTMIERVERKFDLTPKRLVADTAYGATPMLNWIVNEKKIEPHIRVWEKSLRDDGTFSRPDFRFATHAPTSAPAARNSRLRGVPPTGNRLFTALQHDCGSCALKKACCPNTSHRKIARSIYEDARNVARNVCTTPAYEQSRRQRMFCARVAASMRMLF
jgi:hypothetical protein